MCGEIVEPYPTDVTDEQWDLLKEYWPAPKPPKTRGRPPVDQRRMCNALLYFVRGGCAWRMMPRNFGHWETIYGYFRRFKRGGHWKRIHDILRGEVRAQVDKRSQPTAAILDSQSVRAADQAGERGYDKGKNIKGINYVKVLAM